jgi:hypothetical protein
MKRDDANLDLVRAVAVLRGRALVQRPARRGTGRCGAGDVAQRRSHACPGRRALRPAVVTPTPCDLCDIVTLGTVVASFAAC